MPQTTILVGVSQILRLLKLYFLTAFTKHSQLFQTVHFHTAIITTNFFFFFSKAHSQIVLPNYP
jgi:hypothetical protein